MFNTSAPVTNDMVADVIVSTINNMRLHERLHQTVDFTKKWDGTLDATKFRESGINNTKIYKYYIPLTYGALVFSFSHYVNSPHLYYVSFKYILPKCNDRWQWLYRDRLERESYSDNCEKALSSGKKFIKLVTDKVNGLMDGIDEWYKTSAIKDLRSSPTNQSNPHHSRSHFYGYVFGAAGRLRLLSRAHLDSMTANNHSGTGHAERIDELANELLKLVIEQRDLFPDLDPNQYADETY